MPRLECCSVLKYVSLELRPWHDQGRPSQKMSFAPYGERVTLVEFDSVEFQREGSLSAEHKVASKVRTQGLPQRLSGVQASSWSAQGLNPALRLYERLGFRALSSEANAHLSRSESAA